MNDMADCTKCIDFINAGSRFCGACGKVLSGVSIAVPFSGDELRNLLILPKFSIVEHPEKLLRRTYSADDEAYEIDYTNFECSSTDCKNLRGRLPEYDIRKLCKHISRKWPKKLMEQLPEVTQVIVKWSTYNGVPANAQINGYSIEGNYAILIKTPGNPWIDVIAASKGRSKLAVYESFDYNVAEDRWSYKSVPKSGTVIREIIRTP